MGLTERLTEPPREIGVSLMDMNEYQTRAHVFAEYEFNLYPEYGLVEEVGELFSLRARRLRGDLDYKEVNGDEFRAQVKKELGDILWNLSELCGRYKTTLDEVAIANLEKLESRKERGVLKGEGDNR
jgi:NTP pyrophosphatase (non-canonical NTP hydrolase)